MLTVVESVAKEEKEEMSYISTAGGVSGRSGLFVSYTDAMLGVEGYLGMLCT